MTTLLWFSAFNRYADPAVRTVQSIDAIVRILHDGLASPPWRTGTKANEDTLEITPYKAYAYLGRTTEDFGPNTIVIPAGGVDDGETSPFDTGGLVKHIKPVCERPTADKVKYLRSLTFPVAQLPKLLNLYPSSTKGSHMEYLDGAEPPDYDGPHVVLKQGIAHAIWREVEAWWPWWTWELRTDSIGTGRLVAWTCTPGDYSKIIDAAEAKYPNEDDWILQLEQTYYQGGTGKLVEEYRARQAA